MTAARLDYRRGPAVRNRTGPILDAATALAEIDELRRRHRADYAAAEAKAKRTGKTHSLTPWPGDAELPHFTASWSAEDWRIRAERAIRRAHAGFDLDAVDVEALDRCPDLLEQPEAS